LEKMICKNKGCGKDYDDTTECRYHPLGPIFHEGLKGWQCCSKRVIDFNDFMNIPGCTVGKHSLHASDPVSQPAVKQDSQPVKPADIKQQDSQPAKQQQEEIQPVVENKKEEPQIKEEELFDDPKAQIEPNAPCKRRGCNKNYQDETSRTQECVYHPGQPLFHEGSKGYTCCNRKVLEFDEFLKIPGCTTGVHRFTNVLPKPVEKTKHDWYQTPTTIVLDVFAKKADKQKTIVKIEARNVQVDVVYLSGDRGYFETQLFDEIDPEKSEYLVLGTKIELTLKKANGSSWPALAPTDKITSWTTFGLVGTKGTVGGKEMHINSDVPI
ncbi:chord-domain-containing protein, partial [Gorgonomyces haynaldii]